MSIENLIPPIIGTTVAELATLPICTIKTQYQCNLNNRNFSFSNIISNIYTTQGIKGFYSASVYAVSTQIVSTTSKYFVYQQIKAHRKTQDYDIKNNILNGMVSGIIGSTISHPLDVRKIFKQNNENFSQAYLKSGFWLNYRGYTKTLAKNIGVSALLFPTYDAFNSHFSNPLIASVLTTLTVTCIIHPIDFIKTRQMAGVKIQLGLNPLNYYRGIHLNLMRVVPHFSIMMWITEKTKYQMKKNKK
jgi:hypothetical protein